MSSFRNICWDSIRTVDILEGIAEITNDYSFVLDTLNVAVFMQFGFNARPKTARDKARLGVVPALDSILKSAPMLFDQFRNLPVRVTLNIRNEEMMRYLDDRGLYFVEEVVPEDDGHIKTIFRNTELGFESRAVASIFRTLLIDEVCKYEYIYRNFREYLGETNDAKYRGSYTNS